MPSPRIVGRYALYGEIAAGGMATVHLGRLLGEGGVHRLVAIKRLHAQFAKDPEFVTMFLDEGRLTARIHHPNVVSVLDFVVLDGELFLVMEYVQGEPLSGLTRLARKRQEAIPFPVTASVAIGLLQGLHAAHIAQNERGEPLHIVHRDVSPHNVLISVDGVARVVDFGVAKAAGRLQTTREGHIKGKIAYMAPEQLRSEAVDHRADVYGAAVVLWELLVGRRLFTGENEGALLTQIVLGKADPPSRFVQDLPAGWDDVVMKGLAPKPEDRFESAEAMAEAIESVSAVASGRAVGQWVNRLASDSIAKRGAAVRQIEEASDPDAAKVEAAALATLLTPSGARPAEAAAGPDSTSKPRDLEHSAGATSLHGNVTTSTSKGELPRSKALPITIGAVALACLAGAGFFAKTRFDASSQRAAAIVDRSATSDAPPASAAAIATSTNAPTVSVEVAASTVPVPSAIATSTAHAAAPSAKPTVAHPGGQTVAVPTAKPASKPDCSSPFYIDANGDRHVKRECL